MNRVILVGRLTRDPDLRYTANGHAITNVTLALNRRYRNNTGDFITDFISCIIWNRAAENIAQYCLKGALIGITGRLQTRNYENKEGKRVYVTEVVADSVKFMGSTSAGSANMTSGTIEG
ncbi:single-stranded DNA-binding protein [Bacillus massiliigorillae]|uniref:single-stranded DNA-binding protein n=1 Tax=Bacillus massiliigorillae TaxID=1243664 RepID=UPI0003A7E636|nr:single-stranded DNA-binding protein [Bacillus massiliigorillae]